MRKFHVLVHTLLLATSPSLFAYPQFDPPIIQQVNSQEMPYDGFNLTYDGILDLLKDIESGKIEEYPEEKLDRISHFLTFLAQQGMLPREDAANTDLEKDIAALYADEEDFCNYAYATHLNGEENATIMLCKHKHKYKHGHKHKHKKKFFAEVKDFVKKHKKAILIGAAVIIGATVVIIAIAAASTATAVAAASAATSAAATNTPHTSEHAADTPQLKSALENQITTFKETLVTEEHLNGNLPIEENMRTLGSLFAHQGTQELQQQLANSPQLHQEIETVRWYNNGFPTQFGHYDIDQKFSTDYAPLYAAPQTDFNILAYQARGEKALTSGYYEQAVHDFGKAIDLNPSNPLTYLERSVAHFNLGQYDNSQSDYQHYVAQKPTPKEPFSLPSFSLGFAKSLPNGIYDSGEGTLLFLADLIQHPIHTSEQVWDSLVILKDLVKTQAWETIAQTLSPQVHDLVVNWDLLSSYERGKLAGYAFGRHGTDFLLPAAAAKAAKTCQELATVSKNLQFAEKTLLLETAGSIPNGAKIIEANKQAIVIAEDLGMPTSTISHLKQAGVLEKYLSAKVEQLAPELRQSYELFQRAQAFLKPYSKTYITEAQARELIHQTGIKTFPRPAGIPEDYKIKISNTGAGIKYVDPKDTGTSIRVMPGKPHSPFQHQQKPYAVQMKNGKTLDKSGKIVESDIPEAHVPLEEFVFWIK